MSFLHHPDGNIIIGRYVATTSQFAADLITLGISAYPGLPEGAVGRRYIRPGVHFQIFENGDERPLEDVWSWGQSLLARLPDFNAIMDQRLAIPPPSPTMLKTELYARMTDAELAVLEAFLNEGATIRQRMRFRDAVELDRRDAELQGLAAALFGVERAAVLLA